MSYSEKSSKYFDYSTCLLRLCDFTTFMSKNYLKFPNDSESLKNLDIQLWESGAKRRVNRTSKVKRRTNRQTTFRKHWPSGPMLWKLGIHMEKLLRDHQEITKAYHRVCKMKKLKIKITLEIHFFQHFSPRIPDL